MLVYMLLGLLWYCAGFCSILAMDVIFFKKITVGTVILATFLGAGGLIITAACLVGGIFLLSDRKGNVVLWSKK